MSGFSSDEEYEVDVVYPNEHEGSGFCWDMTCPCHEDQNNIQNLNNQVLEGLASVGDADRIYRGRTV